MTEKVILFICSDPELAAQIAHDLDQWPRLTVRTVANLDEAVEYGDLSASALILLYLDGYDSAGQVDALLWALSTGRNPVPVLTLSAFYDEPEALTFFQMGVTEYLSLSDHRHTIRTVAAAIVSPQDSVEVEAEPLFPAWNAPLTRAVSRIL